MEIDKSEFSKIILASLLLLLTCTHLTQSSSQHPHRTLFIEEDQDVLFDMYDQVLQEFVNQQGLVDCPEIPEFKLCPCATTGGGAVHWMLNAGAANKVANPAAEAVEKARQYLSVLTERAARTSSHMDAIQETVQVMTKRILTGLPAR